MISRQVVYRPMNWIFAQRLISAKREQVAERVTLFAPVRARGNARPCRPRALTRRPATFRSGCLQNSVNDASFAAL